MSCWYEHLELREDDQSNSKALTEVVELDIEATKLKVSSGTQIFIENTVETISPFRCA